MQSFRSTRLRSGAFHHEPIIDRATVRHAIALQIENNNRSILWDDVIYPDGQTMLEWRLAKAGQLQDYHAYQRANEAPVVYSQINQK